MARLQRRRNDDQFGPAEAGKLDSKEFPLAAECLALGIQVVHKFIDELIWRKPCFYVMGGFDGIRREAQKSSILTKKAVQF